LNIESLLETENEKEDPPSNLEAGNCDLERIEDNKIEKRRSKISAKRFEGIDPDESGAWPVRSASSRRKSSSRLCFRATGRKNSGKVLLPVPCRENPAQDLDCGGSLMASPRL
jgi:hypothetical protein